MKTKTHCVVCAIVTALFAQFSLAVGAQETTVSGQPAVGHRVPSDGAQPPIDASPLTPVFLLQSGHVVSGQPVMVLLGFKNPSSHVIQIRSEAPPWADSVITITGPDGPLPAGYEDLGPDGGHDREFLIKPGATQFIGTTYYALDHWGYHLTRPGNYTIAVRGLAAGGGSINVQREHTTKVHLVIDAAP